MTNEERKRLPNLLDRAFELARRNGPSSASRAKAREQLAQEFGTISADRDAHEFNEAYERALELLAEAERLAEAMRGGVVDHAAALRTLERTVSGFAPETYRAALGEGLFRTR